MAVTPVTLTARLVIYSGGGYKPYLHLNHHWQDLLAAFNFLVNFCPQLLE